MVKYHIEWNLLDFFEKEIYVEQHQGFFVVQGQEYKVLTLKKALYGLKQA